MADFFIVVPTLNSAQYLRACLTSLTAVQPGTFGLRVHVQDGGSTDDTAAIAKEMRDPRVTFSTAPDSGLYQAVNRAAAMVQPSEIMTWLGSDDMLLPGTLATVASIFDQLPEVEWLTGLPFCGNEAGESFSIGPSPHLIRGDLAAGLHDGRTLDFIMQEGTFWRAGLWEKAGGLDERFKYAGDWDLWRRLARHAAPYSVNLPLARFSRRKGQKSEDMSAYYGEIDAAPQLPGIKDRTALNVFRLAWDEQWAIGRKTIRARPRLKSPAPRPPGSSSPRFSGSRLAALLALLPH
jgi:GT2 family glycosyltransferase